MTAATKLHCFPPDRFCHCATNLSKQNLITCPVSITWNLSNVCAPWGRLFAIGQVRPDWTGKVYHLSDGVKSETVRSITISGWKMCQGAHGVAFVPSVSNCLVSWLYLLSSIDAKNSQYVFLVLSAAAQVDAAAGRSFKCSKLYCGKCVLPMSEMHS